MRSAIQELRLQVIALVDDVEQIDLVGVRARARDFPLAYV